MGILKNAVQNCLHKLSFKEPCLVGVPTFFGRKSIKNGGVGIFSKKFIILTIYKKIS